MKNHLLAAALVAALATGAASANPIVQTDEFGVGYTFETTNWTHTLSALNQFNPLLGTLDSVMVTLTGEMNQNIKAENTGATPDSLTPQAAGSVIFRQGVTNLLTAALSNTGGTFNATAFDGASDFAGTSGVDFGVLSDDDTVMTTYVLAGDLAGFIGVGNLSAYNLRATGNGSVDSDNGNLDTSITTEARGQIEVKYAYTPRQDVPEPASLALVGLALAGLAATRRRKV